MRKLLLSSAIVALGTATALAEGHEEECFDKGDLTYADCPAEEEVMMEPEPMVEPAPDFSGFYIGVDVGVASTEFNGLFDEAGDETVLSEDDIGFLIGAHVGALYQFENNIVVGLEADAAFADLDAFAADDLEGGLFEEIEGEIDFVSSVRGRLGYAIDDFMPYVTGGVGFVGYDFRVQNNDDDPSDTATFDEISVGAVAGGGLEYLLTEYVSLRVEGLYYFTEDRIDLEPGVPDDADDDDFVEVEDLWSVRGGISVRF